MIDIDDIRRAAAVIAGEAIVTPIQRSDVLDQWVGATLLGKDESQQRAGSFKFRGAFHRLSLIPAEDRQPRCRGGVVGQPRCRGGVRGGDPRHSGNGPHSRRRGSRQTRAHRTLRRRHRDVRSDDARPRRRRTRPGRGDRSNLRPPVRGSAGDARSGNRCPGTPRPGRSARCPAGPDVGRRPDGRLCLGDATARSRLRTARRGAGSRRRHPASFAVGHPVRIAQPSTIADGLAVTAPGAATFEINRQLVADVLTVSEEQLVDAMRVALDAFGGGSSPAASPASPRYSPTRIASATERVGLLLSGGNIDDERFESLTGRRGALRLRGEPGRPRSGPGNPTVARWS